MEESITNFYKRQSIETYEKSHGERFDLIAKHLKLDEMRGRTIVDIGCGYGPLFRRSSLNNNFFIGVDGADETSLNLDGRFKYYKKDLDFPFVEELDMKEIADIVFCFELLEHLQNPYGCVAEIKKLVKPEGDIYFSIPHVEMKHNVLYPGLFYPVENFIIFLQQMAFEVVSSNGLVTQRFIQWFFHTKSLSWENSKLVFPKDSEEFKGKSVLEVINS